MADKLSIAVLGGTGDLGGGLAWHVGPIDNAAVAESLTSVLIFMNKRYKFPGAGIKISSGRAA